MKTINSIIQTSFANGENFTLSQAMDKVLADMQVNRESIRARIYESVDAGFLKRIARGIYSVKNCLVINGDGRDLSFIKDGSIDAIITDHPWDLAKSNKGGNRNFADYDCFKYDQQDFNEKARVLKDGAFLVEFVPDESAESFDYLYEIKKMAQYSGFEYYAQVPWIKKGFVSNTGRKSKNSETVLIFTKGKARNLRPDAKKDKAEPNVKHYMSGANGMLPSQFVFEKSKTPIHQAEKPTDLLLSIINYVTLPNELILDQFAGSGVLGEACLKSNRNAILIEFNKEYYENIKKRLNSLQLA